MAKLISVAIVTVLLGLSAFPAHAQLARTFVSSLGSDGNDCSRLTPCRNFQRAHDQTLASGEITVLDPGGYGAVTITKGIGIINDGVGEAGVLVSGGLNGITINAGANDAVTLRGLTVKGIGFGGGNGIVFLAGRALTIENCIVRNLTRSDGSASSQTGEGIVFSSTTAARLVITNTAVTDNASRGILFAPATNATHGILDRVNLFNNNVGLRVESSHVDVIETVASNNSRGFYAFANGRIVLQRSAAVMNTDGIVAEGGGQVIVNESLVFRNAHGWLPVGSGQIFSYVNNAVAGNTGNEGSMPVFTPR